MGVSPPPVPLNDCPRKARHFAVTESVDLHSNQTPLVYREYRDILANDTKEVPGLLGEVAGVVAGEHAAGDGAGEDGPIPIAQPLCRGVVHWFAVTISVAQTN